jgi:hypothetical protein
MNKEIIVDGIKYVPKKDREYMGDIKIVILQRGWVMIGRFKKTGSDCKLYDAYIIRRWGTTNGIGELAGKGKQKDTILDKCFGIVEFDYLTVIATISCAEEKWKNEL